MDLFSLTASILFVRNPFSCSLDSFFLSATLSFIFTIDRVPFGFIVVFLP